MIQIKKVRKFFDLDKWLGKTNEKCETNLNGYTNDGMRQKFWVTQMREMKKARHLFMVRQTMG